LRSDARVLDVAAGNGNATLAAARRWCDVTSTDYVASLLESGRKRAQAEGHVIKFQEADAEQLPFAPGSFDFAISRHLLWTLPHPEAAIDEWIRILRPGGRLVIIDGQFDAGVLAPPPGSARTSEEYAAVGDQLPFLGGRSREEIAVLLTAHGLVRVASDPLLDLVAAQARRMVDEGGEPRTHRRYVVWGDVAR
jgi:ubiquinone/menaquinone biosynthesis C-methylase UbiE